ncbi:MAG: oligosaccharide flippase family protein [Phycisphaerales bacterium]
MSVYAIAAIVSRIVSFASQIVLGRVLTEAQFGVFAKAFGVTAATGCLRSGGVQQYLQTLPQDRFEREVGPYLMIATIAATIGGGATLAAAFIAPAFYGLPEMRWPLVVLAASVFLNAIAWVFRARLQSEMRFVTLAATDLANMFMRAILAVSLAMLGGGALALAVPIMAATFVEFVVFGSRARMRREHWRTSRSELRAAWGVARWTLLWMIGSTVVFQGDYFAASFFVTEEALGVYYFTVSLCNQPNYVIASAMLELVGPAVSRLNDAPERRASAVMRLARGIGVFLPLVAFVVPVLLPELDRMVWRGKWAAAHWPAFLLSLDICFLSATYLLYGAVNAIGAFRFAAVLECIRAAGVVTGAALGGFLFGTPMGLAAMGCLVAGGTSAVISSIILRQFGAHPVRGFLSVLVGPCIVAATMVPLRLGLDAISGWSGADDLHRWRYGIEMAGAGVAYAIASIVLARTVFRSRIREAVAIMPARIARVATLLVGT